MMTSIHQIKYHDKGKFCYLHQHDDVLERQGPRGVNWQTNFHPVNYRRSSSTSEKYKSLAEQHFVPKLYQHQ